jgi:hypothetical protein
MHSQDELQRLTGFRHDADLRPLDVIELIADQAAEVPVIIFCDTINASRPSRSMSAWARA